MEESNNKTWTVVKFESDNTVEAIPTSWLVSANECLWPSFTGDKLSSAIRNNIDINTCWPSFKVTVFRNATYDNYAKARQKMNLAEMTSDLSTDTDENNKKHRKNRRRRISSSASDEDDLALDLLTIPSPPKISNHKSGNNTYVQKKRDCFTSKEFDLEFSPESCLKSKEKELPSIAPMPNASSSAGVSTPMVSTSVSAKVPVRRCETCGASDSKNDTLNKILQQQYFIKSQLLDINSTMAKMADTLVAGGSSCNKPSTTTDSVLKQFSFPLNTLEELENFELFLQNDENFQKSVNEIQQFGGSSTYELIKRSLTFFITNDLAVQYSWLGRRDKKQFCNLRLAKALIEAATIGKSATAKDVETSIAAWLRRASDRIKKNKK